MARNQVERAAQSSLLDRLIDHDPAATMDPPGTLAQSIQRAKAGLRRDLEWLLNTRRTALRLPEGTEELGRSIFHFGLPDVTSLSHDSPEDRNALLRSVERVIATFEPRLADVRVRVSEDVTDEHRRELRFIIEGTFLLDPTPERVAYDTVMDLTKGETVLRGDRA